LAILALIGAVACSPTASGTPGPARPTASAARPTAAVPTATPAASLATASPGATSSSTVGRVWAPLPDAPTLEGTFVGSLFFDGAGPLLAGGFVVKGEGRAEGAVWASDDARAWTRLTARPGFEDAAVGRISRAPDGTFLAVGSTCYYECAGVRIWRSTDGTTWTAVDHDLPESAFVSVIPGGPGWVGLGEVNMPLGALAGWTSADGARWSPATGIGPDPGVVRGFVATADGFVAGGSVYPEDRSEPAVWTSADGTAWARVAATDAPEGLGLEALVELDGLLIALARTDGGIELWTSEAGDDWSLRSGAGAPFEIGGSRLIRIAMVVAGGPGLVAFGAAEAPDSGPTIGIWVTADGLDWQPGEVTAFVPDVEVYDAVRFGDGVLAVGRLPCDIETCVERPAFWISPPG
jgi:hypothetical protein